MSQDEKNSKRDDDGNAVTLLEAQSERAPTGASSPRLRTPPMQEESSSEGYGSNDTDIDERILAAMAAGTLISGQKAPPNLLLALSRVEEDSPSDQEDSDNAETGSGDTGDYEHVIATLAAKPDRGRQVALDAIGPLGTLELVDADGPAETDVEAVQLNPQNSEGDEGVSNTSELRIAESGISSRLARMSARQIASGGIPPFRLPEGVTTEGNPLLEQLVLQNREDERASNGDSPAGAATDNSAQVEQESHIAPRWILPKTQDQPIPNIFDSLAGHASHFSAVISSTTEQELPQPRSKQHTLASWTDLERRRLIRAYFDTNEIEASLVSLNGFIRDANEATAVGGVQRPEKTLREC